MTLDKIIAKIEHAWDSADEDIADYFFQKVQKWEEKGISKYAIGLGIDLSIIIAACGSRIAEIAGFLNLEGGRPYKEPVLALLYEGPALLFCLTAPSMLILDMVSNYRKLHYQNDVKYFSDTKVMDEIDPINKWREILRLPYAAFGVLAVVDYVLPIFKYGPEALVKGNTTSVTATLLTSLLAASFYITHNRPAAADKVPFWKRAYDAIRETVFPSIPIPVTVPEYSIPD